MTFPSAITYTEHSSFPKRYQFPQEERKSCTVRPGANQFAKTIRALENLIRVKPKDYASDFKPLPSVTANFALNVLHRISDSNTADPEISAGEFGDVCFRWKSESVILKLQILRPNDVNFTCLDLATGEEKAIHLNNDFSSVEVFFEKI